ncbi:MAG: RluA family pseudouridine synthase [Planctomycetota bacterium]
MAKRPLSLIYEDDDMLAVDKPARMMSVPAPKGSKDLGLSVWERLRADRRKAIAVHRLDYETSGVLVFAKNQKAADRLIEAFRSRRVEKTYLCLVQGWPSPPRGKLIFPIKDLGASAVISKAGKPAETFYEVIRRVGRCALVEARIQTGRHNQIRLHFAQVGHAIVGERKFARGRDAIVKHKRALLHALALDFIPPDLPQALRIESPLPPDFELGLKKAAAAKSTQDSHFDDGPSPKGRLSSRQRHARGRKSRRR